jgi:hypothetical protein
MTSISWKQTIGNVSLELTISEDFDMSKEYIKRNIAILKESFGEAEIQQNQDLVKKDQDLVKKDRQNETE